MLWTIHHWLELNEHEVLFIEGTEDIDRACEASDAEQLHEQIKLRERSGVSNADIAKVVHGLVGAYCSCLVSGRRFHGVLRTNGSPPSIGGAMSSWIEGRTYDPNALMDELRSLFLSKSLSEHELNRLSSVQFAEFACRISWAFRAESLDDLQARLEARLEGRVLQPITGKFAMGALITLVVKRSIEPELKNRSLTALDLELALNDLHLQPTVEHSQNDVVCIGLFENDSLSLSCGLHATRRQLESIQNRAQARATLIGGAPRTELDSQDILSTDFVVIASLTRKTRNSGRVAVSDVIRQSRYSWPSVPIRISGASVTTVPREFRKSLISSEGTLESFVDMVAKALLNRLGFGSNDLPELAARIRWVHRIDLREYWTQATHPFFLGTEATKAI